MKHLRAVTLAALMFILGAVMTAQAAPTKIGPDPHRCGELVNLVLKQFDRVQVANNQLYQPGRLSHAGLLLTKVNNSWPEFWRLAQECSPIH